MRRVRAAWVGWLVAAAAFPAAAVAHAGELEPAPAGLDARAIARRADRSLRGERTFLELRLTLRKSSDSRQRFRLRLWDDRFTGRCFVRVVAPEDVAGTSFLKLPPNLWTYEAREPQAQRLPPVERKARLLGSEFRIDDLVRASNLAEDYELRLLGVDPVPDGMVGRRAYVLEHVGDAASPGLWARVVAWVDSEWGTPLRREYYDGDGEMVLVIRFGGIREVQGRYFPHVWIASAPKSGSGESRIDVERVDFAKEAPDSTFSTRNLKPPK